MVETTAIRVSSNSEDTHVEVNPPNCADSESTHVEIRCPNCGLSKVNRSQRVKTASKPVRMGDRDFAKAVEEEETTRLMQVTHTCPRCQKTRIVRAGHRYPEGEDVQRFMCKDCGFRFSGRRKATFRDFKKRGVGMKMPAAAELKTVAGETNRILEEAKGKILELCIHLKRQGYSDETIRLNRIALKVLMDRGANLFDEGSVKDVIARQTWSDNRRRNVINAYDIFVRHNGLSWEKPRCNVTAKFQFFPTEQEIDCLISGAGKKLSTFLQLLKETAMRRGEAKRLEWTAIDSERNIITMNAPEKHSNPRMWKVSPNLIGMLNALPKDSQRIFGDSSMESMKSMFMNLRKKLAVKLQNPRLREVNFHSFRHWKATMLMHQTHRDLYYVKQFLGHKSIKNTEVYLHMESIVFGESGNDEFTVKVAEKPEEVKAMLEIGFEYVCQKDNLIFLRKRR